MDNFQKKDDICTRDVVIVLQIFLGGVKGILSITLTEVILVIDLILNYIIQ